MLTSYLPVVSTCFCSFTSRFTFYCSDCFINEIEFYQGNSRCSQYIHLNKTKIHKICIFFQLMSVIMKVKYLLAIALKNQRKKFFKENCLMKYQKGFSNLAGPCCACSSICSLLFSLLCSLFRCSMPIIVNSS